MIPPAFATMLCFVQTDAALAPETADLLLGVCVKRSFDRISVDGQLSTNDTAILHVLGRQRRARRARVRGRAALRRGARRAAAPARARRSCATARAPARIGRVVVRGGHGEQRRARRARGRQLAAGQDRAARRRPQLGPDRAGGRDGAARHRAAARSTSRSRACRSAPAAARSPYDVRGAGAGGGAATRSSTSSGCPATAHETEVFFSDLGHEYVTINAEYTT